MKKKRVFELPEAPFVKIERSTKPVMALVDKVVDVLCNKCGQSCLRPTGYGTKNGVRKTQVMSPAFAMLQHRYGFASERDGDQILAVICEPCLELIVADFKLPPAIGNELFAEEASLADVRKLLTGPIEPVVRPLPKKRNDRGT